jgi:hypothetical protein
MPTAPACARTRTSTVIVLEEEATIITLGITFVFNEETTIECSNIPTVEELIMSIAKYSKGVSRVVLIQSLKIIKILTEENIPRQVTIKETLTNSLALPKLLS